MCSCDQSLITQALLYERSYHSNNFLAVGMASKFYSSVEKLKARKFLGTIPTVVNKPEN